MTLVEEQNILDLLEYGMVLICNAGGGDWGKEHPDWQTAARKFIAGYGKAIAPTAEARGMPYRDEDSTLAPLPSN